ncbi:MAG: YceI family protein [Chitinophagales bacterium]
MKKIMMAALALAMIISASAQYKPIDEGSSVQFKLKNFGFNTGGVFSGLKGTIDFNAEKPTEGKFDVTIEAASVNTDNTSRDSHLKEEAYFDVKNHPQIRFVSTKIVGSGKAGNYSVTGNLTIKKTTKELSFPFTASQQGDGYLFNGDFKINRKDYGVGGSSTLSDGVEVLLKIQTRKR